MVVTSSLSLMSATRTEHGLKALPLRWEVQALQTLMPQPYFGPVSPTMSRITHSRRTSSSTSTVVDFPLRTKVCLGKGLLSSVGVAQAVGRRLRHGRHEALHLEGERVVVVDRELRRHLPGGPRVRTRDGGGRGRHPGLTGAAGLVGPGVDDDGLELVRDVPLPRVEVIVPAGLEE